MVKNNYLDVVYNEKERPLTEYPDKLTSYLFETYELKKKQKIIDIGCGRGEFINGFINCGMDGYAIDQDYNAKKFFPNINLKICDIQKDKFPYEDSYFDVIFSKSLIEHFYYPEKIFLEMKRILKPGGKIITMTPDWDFNYINFYEDFTHRTPFSKTSLKDIQLISGFQNVQVERFKQLPILWHKKNEKNLKFYFFSFLSEITRICVPNVFKKYKWVRFSKEIMLLSISIK